MKENEKYTKGEWKVDKEVRTSINCGDKHICMVNWYNSIDPKTRVIGEEHEANIRLIVNAPRMKKMIEEIFEILHSKNPQNLIDYNYACRIRNLINEIDDEKIDIGRICYYCGGILSDTSYDEWANGKRCCNGTDCGCMGLPIDPPCCEKCANTIDG